MGFWSDLFDAFVGWFTDNSGDIAAAALTGAQIWINLYFMQRSLETYMASKAMLECIAEENQALAERIFEKHKEALDKQRDLRDEAASVPDYVPQLHKRRAARRADVWSATTIALNKKLDDLDCYEEGEMLGSIREAALLTAAESVKAEVEACLIENNHIDNRKKLQLGGLIDGSDRASNYDAVAALSNQAGQYYAWQAGQAAQTFNGSLAAIGYNIGSVLNRYSHTRESTDSSIYERQPYDIQDPTNPIYSDFYGYGNNSFVPATVGL